VDVFGIRETISREFILFERLASTLWIPQIRERLIAVLHGAAMSAPFAYFRRCALEPLVEALLTEVVKTWQSLWIFRNVVTNDTLETAK